MQEKLSPWIRCNKKKKIIPKKIILTFDLIILILRDLLIIDFFRFNLTMDKDLVVVNLILVHDHGGDESVTQMGPIELDHLGRTFHSLTHCQLVNH